MAEAPAKEFSAEVKDLGDKISQLTIKTAQELVDYLKEAYGIEPAGGAVMAMPAAGGGGAAPAEAAKDSFDVILANAGDKKIQVIKVVRAITGLGLKEAKDLVDGAPKPIKEGVSKEDAEKIKKEIEENGGSVTIK